MKKLILMFSTFVALNSAHAAEPHTVSMTCYSDYTVMAIVYIDEVSREVNAADVRVRNKLFTYKAHGTLEKTGDELVGSMLWGPMNFKLSFTAPFAPMKVRAKLETESYFSLTRVNEITDVICIETYAN